MTYSGQVLREASEFPSTKVPNYSTYFSGCLLYQNYQNSEDFHLLQGQGRSVAILIIT